MLALSLEAESHRLWRQEPTNSSLTIANYQIFVGSPRGEIPGIWECRRQSLETGFFVGSKRQI